MTQPSNNQPRSTQYHDPIEKCMVLMPTYDDDGTEKDTDYWIHCLKDKPCPLHEAERSLPSTEGSVSEPKSDEEIIKEIKSFLPKDPNAITDWWDFDRKVKATLAAVREEEREQTLQELKDFCATPTDEYKDVLLNQIETFEALDVLDATQDDTNLST